MALGFLQSNLLLLYFFLGALQLFLHLFVFFDDVAVLFLELKNLLTQLFVFRNLSEIALVSLGQVGDDFIVFLRHLSISVFPLIGLLVLLSQEHLLLKFQFFLL